MNSKLRGIAEFTFIRGGIAKSGNPYLQVSNGRSEFFVNVPKGSNLINENTFNEYSEDDMIQLEVEVLPGTDSVTLHSIVE